MSFFGAGWFGAATAATTSPLVVAYDSADLVRRCKRYASRPEVDPQFPDDDWYGWLTEGQSDLLADIARYVPHVLKQQATKLVTRDGGYTYEFGLTSAGERIVPIGHAEIWQRQPGSAMLYPGSDSGMIGDFILEVDRIRMPNNQPRLFDDGPWARWVGPAPAITDTQQPVLQPRDARMILVWDALARWADVGARRDPSGWLARREDSWKRWLKVWQTQVKGQWQHADPFQPDAAPINRTVYYWTGGAL
jgi:hypothetical protein